VFVRILMIAKPNQINSTKNVSLNHNSMERECGDGTNFPIERPAGSSKPSEIMQNKISRFNCAIAAVLMLGTSIVRADTITSQADLPGHPKALAYIESKDALGALIKLGFMTDQKFGFAPSCTSMQATITPVDVFVLSPIEFTDASANPVRGAWINRYRFERCGESRIYNAAFVAKPSGEMPAIVPYFPGNTRAGMLLIKDALPTAVLSAKAQTNQATCKAINVVNMELKQAPHTVTEGNVTHNGVWNETWSFQLCGKTAEVDMTFIPDANGGGTTFITRGVASKPIASQAL